MQKVWGKTPREGYGQTETTLQIGCFPGQTVKPGSMGQESPGYRIRLLDAEDNAAEEGEVCIDLNPPPVGLMRGYQNDDGTFAPLGSGAYRTGDVATRDADGYYTYVGRADDVFKASDYRISPFELESALIEHPAVAEAAVVPAPDPMRMAVPKAYVTLTAGAEPNRDTALSIFRHLRRTAGAVQARAPHRIRRSAEDDLRQDPPRRAAPGRGSARQTGRPRRSGIQRARFSGTVGRLTAAAVRAAIADMTESPRPPLVVHVFPAFAVGGAQVRFAALANHFGGAFRHVVVSLDGNLACAERLDASLDVTFPAIDAPKHKVLANVLRYRRLVRAWRPDVLVTCNWGAIEWAMANRPAVTRHVHIEDGFGPEERDEQIRRRVLTRRFVLARSTVVLPSRNLWRIATGIWGLAKEHVHYVPNGIDLQRFVPAPHTAVREVPVIGTVAALRKEKNLGRLLRAFAGLTMPARLAIVGDGPERPALEALAGQLGIAGRVTFLGHIDDPSTVYAGFDVFALSSDTEQMPLSLIEAMAAGLAVAATDVGDVRSMLAEPNRSFVGKLYEFELARSLAALLADPALRGRLGQANRAKAEREFDQASMFRAYAAVWRGLPLAVDG